MNISKTTKQNLVTSSYLGNKIAKKGTGIYFPVKFRRYKRLLFFLMKKYLALVFCFFMLKNGIAQQKPNIILIMADDMGYSDIGCYGGEVQTPNINQLAQNGIRYKQFYNAARCCPTRASLMTGLYPHQAGMGWMAAADLGTPEYQDNLNEQCVTIAEVLKTAGYSTAMTGKWHLTNERKIDGKVTESWPHQRGFERYFGIIPGGANYFTPTIYSNNRSYKAPENFYLTHAITDTSVRYIDEHFKNEPQKPLFMYVAYTAPHWPLHALKADIDKYKNQYKTGWDKLRQQRFQRQKELGIIPKNTILSPRDATVPAWNNLSAGKQNEMAMRMAIYAAQIDAMDQGIGKIVAELKAKNQLDNTLIFFLSDNGACAEFISSGENKTIDGNAGSFESYRINWANLSSTPFREYKHFTHEGGIAAPLIMQWPKGINPKLNNTLLNDYGHITDIMATCVEVSGATYPKTYAKNSIVPMEGKSLTPNFTGKNHNRGAIYWEHEANIALRNGAWKMVAKTPENGTFNVKTLELYNLDADPSEMKNLAQKEPARLQTMYANWLKWAKRIHVFPLDTREYGERIQAYRRNINGTFDDHLGGWALRKNPSVKGAIDVDTTARMTGKNSAKISITQPGERPNALAMTWNFRAQKGQKYTVALNTKSNRDAQFYFRLEQVGNPKKLFDQQITSTKTGVKTASPVLEIPGDGQYQLALYFGSMKAGDQVWVDDVQLQSVQK